jgi:putative solute:sodium symporter small subunit
MTDNDTQTDARRIATDGGRGTADYLDAEINLFKPSTPFMRDHLKVVWATFLAWTLFVFGPVTATALAPELMTGTIVMGFQLHFLLTAIGAPAGALVLSAVYAWQRDRLDRAYGISHGSASTRDATAATATDGGESP